MEAGPEAAAARIDNLATLPVFFKLKGRRVLLVGGGDPAVWKAELLAAAGAHVHVHADVHTPGMQALAAAPSPGKIILSRRVWGHCDLLGAAIAIGAFEDEAKAAAFAAAVRSAGVPVNVIDKPEFCDFQFGALVNRSPLVVAISTDGAAPVFGQAIRARIETLLPKGFQQWAEAAKTWRARFQQEAPDFRTRRRFWERFSATALASPDRPPNEADYTTCLAAARGDAPSSDPTRAGRISVIRIERGLAGAEAVDRLTLQAVRLLGAADVVVHDIATPATVLEFARREARRIAIDDARADVADLLIELAGCGQQVVRLMLASREHATAELSALQQAGVTVEMVPTVT